ncbi:MAG: nuclear transport factor 2 family protein [Bacteroidota bacterium]
MTIKDELIRAEKEWQAAMKTSDQVALERLLHDEALITHERGEVLTKAQEIARYQSGPRIEVLIASAQIYRVFGDTGIVSLKISMVGKFAGEPFKGTYRYTHVWQQEEQTWQLIASAFVALK